MSPPGSAVVIPHYRDVERLERCLAALHPQLADGDQAVVVDNDSGIDLSALGSRFPKVRFIIERERGAAAARNRGVAESACEQICFLDADCVPAADWLATARRVGAESDLIGGRIDTFDEGAGPRTGAQAFETVFAFHQRDYVERKGFSASANLLTTRAVFQEVGGFIVGVSEDLEWCRRAVSMGKSLVYRDDLVVSHPTRGDWDALVKKWRRLTEETFELTGGGITGRLRWAARSLGVVASIAPHALKVFRSRDLDAGARWRGFATLVRLRLTRAGWMLRQSARGRQSG